jgi:hypothetical protein
MKNMNENDTYDYRVCISQYFDFRLGRSGSKQIIDGVHRASNRGGRFMLFSHGACICIRVGSWMLHANRKRNSIVREWMRS